MSQTDKQEKFIQDIESILRSERMDIHGSVRRNMEIAGKTAEGKGFWEGKEVEDRFPEAIALIHGELSEALEAHRNDNHTGDDSILEELVDVMLRVYDLAYHYEQSRSGESNQEFFDLQLTKKMQKNLERDIRHGKKY